jgi:hypothetical protein
MGTTQAVIEAIRVAFRETPYPGDAFLIGSHDGCEPAEVIAPFVGVADWSRMSADVLDSHSEALSFLSDGGFRFFLPAYLIADLEAKLATADPTFHLVHGFSDTAVRVPTPSRTFEKTIGKSALLNPRRYGAIRFVDYARYRLSVFAREEAAAIVEYLRSRRDRDPGGLDGPAITAALDAFWLDRVEHAPTQAMLRRHVEAEAAYVKHLQTDRA